MVLANADVRRRLGERAVASRLLSAVIAAGAVAFNWLAHADHLIGGFFAGMSALGYLVWLMHTENQRRDRLRATGDLAWTTPAYEVVGHWLAHPWLTRRARALAKADPDLGLYDSLAAARTAIRRERRQSAIAKVLHRKIRAAVDPTTADIAVHVYDLEEIATRLADSADYSGLTALIAVDLAPARLAAAPQGRRGRRGRIEAGTPAALTALPGVPALPGVEPAAGTDAEPTIMPGTDLTQPSRHRPDESARHRRDDVGRHRCDHPRRPGEPVRRRRDDPGGCRRGAAQRCRAAHWPGRGSDADRPTGTAALRTVQVPGPATAEFPVVVPGAPVRTGPLADVAGPLVGQPPRRAFGTDREPDLDPLWGPAGAPARPSTGRSAVRGQSRLPEALLGQVEELLPRARGTAAAPGGRNGRSVRSAGEPEQPAIAAAAEPTNPVPVARDGSLRSLVHATLNERVPPGDPRDNTMLVDLVTDELQLSELERLSATNYVHSWRTDMESGRRVNAS